MNEFLQNNKELVQFAAGAMQILFYVAIAIRIRKWYKRRNAYNKDLKDSKKVFDVLTSSPGKMIQQMSALSEPQVGSQEKSKETENKPSDHLNLFDIKETLRAEIQTFEQVRQKLLGQKGQNKGVRRYIRIGLIAAILFATLMTYINSGEGLLTFVVFMMMSFMSALGYGIFALISGFSKMTKSHNIQLEYRDYYKKTVLPAILKTINPSLEFEPDPVEVKETDRIWLGRQTTKSNHSGSRYYHDLLKGEIHGIPVKIAEMELQRDMGDQSSYAQNSVFSLLRALVLKAKFNKNLSGDTLMIPDFTDKNLEREDGLASALKEQMFGEKDRSDDQLWGLQRVQLESPGFEAFFNVYSSDQVEARYIFTPSFMEQILALKQETKDAIFFLRFSQEEMILNIHWKRNYFEPPSVKTPVGEGEFLAEAVREVHELSRLVEILGLNQKLWTYSHDTV